MDAEMKKTSKQTHTQMGKKRTQCTRESPETGTRGYTHFAVESAVKSAVVAVASLDAPYAAHLMKEK